MGSPIRVLVVDDSGFSRTVIASFLQKSREGATVVEAENGGAALEMLGKDAFDVITIDLHMPGMDGLALASEIRSRSVSTPLVLITANVQEAIRTKAESLRVAFVPKPVTVEKIRGMLEEVCP